MSTTKYCPIKVMMGDVVKGVKIKRYQELNFCEGLVMGKMTRKPFEAAGETRSERKMCGPMEVESLSGEKIGILRSDNGGEYGVYTEFKTYLKKSHETTVPHTPRCELRIPRVSESNRCNTVRRGLWERTTLGRRYFFSPTL